MQDQPGSSFFIASVQQRDRPYISKTESCEATTDNLLAGFAHICDGIPVNKDSIGVLPQREEAALLRIRAGMAKE